MAKQAPTCFVILASLLRCFVLGIVLRARSGVRAAGRRGARSQRGSRCSSLAGPLP